MDGLSPLHFSKRGSTLAAVAVAAVEDLAGVQRDGLQQPVLLDVVHELAEFGPIHRHEREEGGGGVELELGGRRGLVGVGSVEVLM